MTNPDTLPTSGDLAGPCPWCGRVSSFSLLNTFTVAPVATNGIRSGMPDTRVSLLNCQGCDHGVLVVSDAAGNGIHWWPAPGAGTLDPGVNEGVASAYDEGMRCLGIGANRAAAVMFRAALHLFVKDKGDEKAKEERHLKTALKFMKDSGHLHQSLWDWADHLNQLGNEGAHPEDYDDVTADEADALAKFVRFMIEQEYELPARLRRARGEV
jgi:Domain of unknown function (DUF4145)